MVHNISITNPMLTALSIHIKNNNLVLISPLMNVPLYSFSFIVNFKIEPYELRPNNSLTFWTTQHYIRWPWEKAYDVKSQSAIYLNFSTHIKTRISYNNTRAHRFPYLINPFATWWCDRRSILWSTHPTKITFFFTTGFNTKKKRDKSDFTLPLFTTCQLMNNIAFFFDILLTTF